MSIHKSVLLKEAVELLNLKKGATVVDATLGGGGHAREILKAIDKEGILVAIDCDEKAIENFRKSLLSTSEESKVDNFSRKRGKIILVRDNFVNLKKIISESGIKLVDAIIADLGYSSDQLADFHYGISFSIDAPLDMRLDRRNILTAEKVVNEYSQSELEKILKNYGEEKFSQSIAKKIIEARKNRRIKRTLDLAEIIRSAIPEKYRKRRIDAATKTFQAIRIEVNRELINLKEFISQAIEILKPEGRLAIISFHSLEDRIVKNIFRANAGGCICPPDFPKCICKRKAKIKLINKKPITPSQKELSINLRSRSAKLRVCEKL